MFKKYAFPVVIGLAALSSTLSAVANNNYYDDSYYTKAPIPVASPSPYYNTSDAGFVLGLEGGYADTHWDNINFIGSSISDSGFAARAFIGYDFNQYFALENGYVYLPKATVDNFDASISNYAIDLLGKISVPVTSGLRVYAKAGLGYLHSSENSNFFNENTVSHFGPAFGVGAGYEIVPNLALNLSWMRYSGNGDLNDNGNYQPNPDVVLFGLSYKIPITS